MEHKNIPEIRFSGFTNEWEERKLVSMTNYKNGKGHEDKQSTIGKFELINLNSISISGGLKHSGKFIDEADDTLQKDDLVMILSDVGHGDLLGRVALIPEDDRFVLNQRVALLRPNATADPQFLFSYINAHQYYFKAQGAGMSQLNISKGSVENFISFVPIIEEQKKIGTFFKQLDNTITLHQRKLDLLKEQKKGFLQKMFPKNGETVPELRFSGFTNEWEERKLSDISNVTKLAGFEFTKYVRYQESGKIIALRGLNVKNGKLVLDEVKYIDDSDFSKLNRSKLYKNDILLTYVGTVGELAIVPENDKYYLAPNVARIRLQDHVNSIFVCQMMNDSNFYNRIISPLIATSSQPALSMENVRKFQLLMPDYQEQEKIGSFFKQLDDTIALHQRKLELLKEQKKGFLQKMFPKNS